MPRDADDDAAEDAADADEGAGNALKRSRMQSSRRGRGDEEEDEDEEAEDEGVVRLVEDDSDTETKAKAGAPAPMAAASAATRGGEREKEPAGPLPLVEKYRPKDMSEVVAQDDIIGTLTRLMEANQLPHLLLYGPPGTGKTSTILAVARKLYGTEKLGSMVMELNASDARGIDDVREQVVTFASTRKIFSSGMKLVILDEADNMTRDAQYALRRIIEKYAANTRFCLICNYVSKIIPALQSRCTRFRFSPLAPERVIARVREICVAEGIQATSDGVDALLALAKGDMRKVLNLLEASAMQSPGASVDAKLVYTVAGKPTPKDVADVAESLWNHELNRAIDVLNGVNVDKGFALTDIVTELHEVVLKTRLPPTVMSFLLTELADAEHRLASAVDDRIQLAGLVGVFAKARGLVRKEVAAANGAEPVRLGAGRSSSSSSSSSSS